MRAFLGSMSMSTKYEGSKKADTNTKYEEPKRASTKDEYEYERPKRPGTKYEYEQSAIFRSWGLNRTSPYKPREQKRTYIM